jgi:hypothetical protein
MSENCKDCRAFNAVRFHSELCRGECRKSAPTMGPCGSAAWPIVHMSDWCSKFIKRDDHEPSTKHISEVIPQPLKDLISEFKTSLPE